MTFNLLPTLIPTTLPILISALFTLTLLYHILVSHLASLSHIPGPILARYTNLYTLYHAYRIAHLNSDKISWYRALQSQYGDIVRLGPRSVIVFDIDAVPLIYGVRVRLDKGPAYIPFRQPGVTASLVSMRDERTHGTYRKMVSNAFSLSALKAYEPCIDQQVNRFLEVCDEHATEGKIMNLSMWCQYYCYDVVSMLTMGKALGFMDGTGQDKFGLVKRVKAFGRYVLVLSPMPWLHTIFRENPIARRAKPSPFVALARQRVHDRLDVEEKPAEDANWLASKPDLLSHFLETHRTNPLMSRDNVVVMSTSNLVAGGLSPGSTMDRLCHFLARHPQAQEILYKELDGAGISTPVPFDKIQDLPYLDGVIREALRLHGSASLGLQRITGKAGLDLPGGVHLPANTLVMCSAEMNNRDGRLWGDDPDVYRPERWMKCDGEDDEAHQERRARYDRPNLTFGSGSRSCIGKNIAILEILKVVASLTANFQFELIGEAKKGEVLVQARRRKSSLRQV